MSKPSTPRAGAGGGGTTTPRGTPSTPNGGRRQDASFPTSPKAASQQDRPPVSPSTARPPLAPAGPASRRVHRDSGTSAGTMSRPNLASGAPSLRNMPMSPTSSSSRAQQQQQQQQQNHDDDYDDDDDENEDNLGGHSYSPPTYFLDRRDRKIDERAEFLGMDVQDFRELLVLAARRTREQLAVESGAVDRGAGAGGAGPSSTAQMAHSLAADGTADSAAGLGVPPSAVPTSRSGFASSSATLLDDQHIPEGAEVAYLSVGTSQQNPSYRSELPSSASDNNVVVTSPTLGDHFGGNSHPQLTPSVGGSTLGTRDSYAASDAGGRQQPRMSRSRESVASLIRFVGDGLFGRRVMWADEAQDDDEVIAEYDDDEDEGGYYYDDEEGGSDTTGGTANDDRSLLSGSDSASSTRARKASSILSSDSGGGGQRRGIVSADGLRRRKVKHAHATPLVKVTTYDVNGQMIMGVQRIGQWRGWLWLISYFVYHILIEYSSAQVGQHDPGHGRQVLRARAYGAVCALLIALVFVGVARCVKSRAVSRSRKAWSLGTNGLILMSACGMLLGGFEAFFWGSLHSKFKNGALVVYPTMFIGPIIVILLRRPFFPARYFNNVSQIPDRVRLAGSGGGTGEGRVVYMTEAISCAVIIIGSVVMCFSFPGNIDDWKFDILLQLGACACATVAIVCLAVLAQRGLLRYSVVAITACRAVGYFAVMLSNEFIIAEDHTSFYEKVPPVLWLSLLMGIDYILFLSATMRSNQHLDIMAMVVVQCLNWIEVPVLSVLLSPNDFVADLGAINPQWVLWLGAAIVLGGVIGLGVFATLRQQFIMYDLWTQKDLFLRPKGHKGRQAALAAAAAAGQ